MTNASLHGTLMGDAVQNFKLSYARSFEKAREQRQYIFNVQIISMKLSKPNLILNEGS